MNWANNIRKIINESVPFYPEEPAEVTSAPVSIDVNALEYLVNWTKDADPLIVNNVINSIKNAGETGEIVDLSRAQEITSTTGVDEPNIDTISQEPPVAPMFSPDQAPLDTEVGVIPHAPVEPALPVEPAPLEEPVGGEIIDPEQPLEEPVGDEIIDPEQPEGELEVPSVPGEEEDEEEIRKELFKSFF